MVIKDLLRVQGKTESEFAEYFWEGKHTNWSYLYNRTAVNSTTLERLAAFFHCSMDVFFTPNRTEEGQNIIGNNNYVGTFNINNGGLAGEISWLRDSLKSKEELLLQKDETIAALKDQILLLRGHCEQGRNSDAGLSQLQES